MVGISISRPSSLPLDTRGGDGPPTPFGVGYSSIPLYFFSKWPVENAIYLKPVVIWPTFGTGAEFFDFLCCHVPGPIIKKKFSLKTQNNKLHELTWKHLR